MDLYRFCWGSILKGRCTGGCAGEKSRHNFEWTEREALKRCLSELDYKRFVNSGTY